jgi:predicted RNase H-like HicB family nuclease
MRVETEREEDGRWIAEVPELPGVMAYGPTREEAIKKVEALALRVIVDRLEHNEAIPEIPVPGSHLALVEDRLAEYLRDSSRVRPAREILDLLGKKYR